MNVLKRVAKAHGVSEKEVREEIKIAIKAGRENPDPQARMMWDKFFPDGKEPTPEEFIKVIAGEVKARSGC